jgi:hypothetical protein
MGFGRSPGSHCAFLALDFGGSSKPNPWMMGAQMHELGGQEIGSTSRGREPSSPLANSPGPTIFRPFASDSWRAELSRVIEGQILPRLLLAHCRDRASEPSLSGEAPADPKIAEFVDRLLAQNAQGAWDFVANLERSMRTQEILIEILGPTARELGALGKPTSVISLKSRSA